MRLRTRPPLLTCLLTYDVSREAHYIAANRAAPLWNYDR